MDVRTRLGLGLSAVALSAAVACGTTVRGDATAPTNVRPYTTTTTRTTTTTTAEPPSSGGGSETLPPQAYDEVRAAGIVGPDDAIADQISIACIMAASSFNDSVQDVVDVLIQMGSKLSPEALDVIVRVGVKYECPEEGPKLGI